MKCPICNEELIFYPENETDGNKSGKTYKCRNNHSFDLAKSGYINLSGKQKPSGDNKEMVEARTEFLNRGYYDFLRRNLLKIINHYKPEVLVDIGCGEGWYTKEFAEAVDGETYGIDLSKEAILHASKQDKKTQYIVGSIYHLPFEDNSVDVITSIFTPIPEEEARRVLKPGGIFVTAGPGKMHHYELKDVLYDKVRLNDPPADVKDLEMINREEIQNNIHVENPEELLNMTPYRYKCSKEGLKRVQDLKEKGLNVTFDFVVTIWKKPLSAASKLNQS